MSPAADAPEALENTAEVTIRVFVCTGFARSADLGRLLTELAALPAVRRTQLLRLLETVSPPEAV